MQHADTNIHVPLFLTSQQEEAELNEFTFIRFSDIGNYPIGSRNIGGNYNFPGDGIVPSTLEVDHLNIKGPKFDIAMWGWTLPINRNLPYFPSEAKRKIIWIDTGAKDIASQIENIDIGIIHISFPTRYENLVETDTSALKDIVNMFAPFDNIKFVFSNLWDIWGYEFDDIDITDYLSDILNDVPQHRIFMFLCNEKVVTEFKHKMPSACIEYHSVYPRRIYVSNRNFENNENPRRKHFLNLNNFEKTHRTEIFNFLNEELDFNKSYTSYVAKNSFLEEPVNHTSTHFTFWQDNLPHGYYTDSLINIVNETWFDYDYYVPDEVYPTNTVHRKHRNFFTEKTYKPIYFEQIFLVVGLPYTHQSLTKLGFKLFHDIIDYSFDTEINSEKRMSMIKEQITKLSNIDIDDLNKYYFNKECQQILKHNKEIFTKMRTFSINKYIKEHSNG